MMTPEAQRIAIAEACGLEVLTKPNPDDPAAWNRGCFTPSAAKERRKNWVNSAVVKIIPDYLNDLNAMHEAEKILIRPNLYAKGGWGTYLRHLSIVTDEQHPIDATAAQRAEAFLRTIGKWEGE